MSAARFTWGFRSDVGRVREINQDAVHAEDGLFVVADGMGGHRGGEVASAVAVEVFAEPVAEAMTLDHLIDRVRDAHEAIIERAEADPELLGMGTTLCALARLAHDGDTLGLVNVGDSRIYRFADGELTQISQDHSFVGNLVRAGRLSPEQAAQHPQRNIVTRALGVGDDLFVDYWELPARAGDRYLLCSDGLVDEVTDAQIAASMRRLDDPEETVDDLVRLAHESGSRDNVTVLVVRVDEGKADFDEAAAAAPHVSAPEGLDPDVMPDPRPVAVDDGAPAEAGEVDEVDEGEAYQRPRGSRRRSLISIAVVVVILGAGIWLVGTYARDNYYVGFDQDQIVIYQGRPGGVLWFDPTVEEPTPFLRVDLTDALALEVDANPEFGSFDAARDYLAALESRALAGSDPDG